MTPHNPMTAEQKAKILDLVGQVASGWEGHMCNADIALDELYDYVAQALAAQAAPGWLAESECRDGQWYRIWHPEYQMPVVAAWRVITSVGGWVSDSDTDYWFPHPDPIYAMHMPEPPVAQEGEG